MGILLSVSCVSTTVWLHHLDFNEALPKKARWELHKEAVSCLGQILEAAPFKTEIVLLLIYYLTNLPSMTSKTDSLMLKEIRINLCDFLQWTPTHGHTSSDQPAKSYIFQLGVDIECHQED